MIKQAGTETEEIIETSDEEILTINTPDRDIIMILRFKKSSESKFFFWINNLRVKLLRQPKKRSGMHLVKLDEGDDIGRPTMLLGKYVDYLDENTPSVSAQPPLVPLVLGIKQNIFKT